MRKILMAYFCEPVKAAQFLKEQHLPWGVSIGVICLSQVFSLYAKGLSPYWVLGLSFGVTAVMLGVVAPLAAILCRLMGGVVELRQMQDALGLFHVPLLLPGLVLVGEIKPSLHYLRDLGPVLSLLGFLLALVPFCFILGHLNSWNVLPRLRALVCFAIPLVFAAILPFNFLLNQVAMAREAEEVEITQMEEGDPIIDAAFLEEIEANAVPDLPGVEEPTVRRIPAILDPKPLQDVEWSLGGDRVLTDLSPQQQSRLQTAFTPHLRDLLDVNLLEGSNLIETSLKSQRGILVVETTKTPSLGRVLYVSREDPFLFLVGGLVLEREIPVALKFEKTSEGWKLTHFQLVLL